MANLSLNCLNDLAADKLAGPIPSVTIMTMFFSSGDSMKARYYIVIRVFGKYAQICNDTNGYNIEQIRQISFNA